MAGFNSPSILFLNTYDSLDRKYVSELAPKLLANGYDRYAELYAGAFVMPLVMEAAGWKPEQMHCYDVTLFSNVLGYTFSGKDVEQLGVSVDGQPLELSGDYITKAAQILYAQALCRIEKSEADYYLMLADDMRYRKEQHITHIANRIAGMDAKLHGLHFSPLYLWDAFEAEKDGRSTFICTNPPTYKGAYEKFFDTDGRLTWNQIDYPIWDGKTDCPELAKRAQGQNALLLFLQQADKGNAATEEPVSARYLSETQNVYYNSNHPELIEPLMGVKSETANGSPMVKAKMPILEQDYEVTKQSRISVQFAETAVAEYYRHLWLHRINGKSVSVNLGVYIDNKVAGFIGLSVNAIMSPYAGTDPNDYSIVLAYAVPAPNTKQRIARLLVDIAKSKPVVESAIACKTGQFAAMIQAANKLKTVEYSRFTEVKGLRGLMKVERKAKIGEVNALTYSAPLTKKTLKQIKAEFISKEEAYKRKAEKNG